MCTYKHDCDILLDQLHYKYVFENSPRAIDVCNIDGLIIDMNKSSENLWKINKDDFIDKQNFFNLERIKNNTKLLETIKLAIETKSIKDIKCYLTHDNSGEIKWIYTTVFPVINNNHVDRFVILNDDLTARVKIKEEREALYLNLIYKNQIFESLSIISKVMLECGDPININTILQIIGETLDVTRAYLYEILPLNNKILCKYEYTKWNIKSFIDDDNINNKTLEEIGLPFTIEDLNNKKIIIVNDINTLERKDLFINQNIRSFILLPVFVSNKPYGFIGFDSVNIQRDWKDCEIEILKNISNLIGSFIKKCYYEKRLDKFIQDQSLILDNLDSYIWFFRDINTYGFINQKYYDEFIVKKDLIQNSYKDDCLLNDCHIQEESDLQKSTNQQVLDSNTILEYKQWMTNKFGNKRLLNIKKLPIDKYIVCIANDITDQYFIEEKMLKSLKTIFNEKTAIIDNNLDQIKQTLDDSKEIVINMHNFSGGSTNNI